MTDEQRLEFPFSVGGFDHELLAREGDVCLVQRGPDHFEVIIVQHREAETAPSGKSYPAREAYPGTAQWGEAGWSYAGSERSATLARERFDLLVRRQARTSRKSPGASRTGGGKRGGLASGE